MYAPWEPHFSFMKRIIHYIQGTLNYGLRINAYVAKLLVAYLDANWGDCPDSRRFTSWYYVFLGDNLMSWFSKWKFTIYHWSVEVAYHKVAYVVSEASWIHNLLLEIYEPILKATVVYCDNISDVYLSQNPVQHQCTKQ